MIISHTHKFIFFCSSKVGTSSMEAVLAPFQEGAEYEFGSNEAAIVPRHIPPAILKGALSERIWNSYFKFVFVRNPWDWFISQWFYNSLGARPETLPEHQTDAAAARRGLRGALPGLRRRPQAPPPQPSLIRTPRERPVLQGEDVDAVFDVLKRFKGLPGRDGLYQSNWVYDMDDRILVDYVGRYETLHEDFQEILRHLQLDLSLPHLNRTDHGDYRSYYSSEARDRVGERWAVDVKNFGYRFDPTPGCSPSPPEESASGPGSR